MSIPGRATLLVVDGSGNQLGWEHQFTDRVFSTMRRRGLFLKEEALTRVNSPEELTPYLQPEDAFNCILLFAHGANPKDAPGTPLAAYWSWLMAYPWRTQKLFAVCTWEGDDPQTTKEVLEAPNSFAPLALAPLSPLSVREAGLYFLKFFAELDLHTEDAVTGKMVWFSASKAREILRRRKLTGAVGVRC
ncbi:MAG: hypothetical protein EXR55_02515 [Dehalococcoidia bacterium]|nr:hypothetical protein [Dehalococcoidia bacterium]